MQRRLPICWHQNILHISISGRTGSRSRRRVNNKSRIFHYDGAEDTWWNMRASCSFFLRAARVDIAFVRRLFIAPGNARPANYGNLCIRLCNRTLLPKNFRLLAKRTTGKKKIWKRKKPIYTSQIIDCVMWKISIRAHICLYFPPSCRFSGRRLHKDPGRGSYSQPRGVRVAVKTSISHKTKTARRCLKFSRCKMNH